MNSKNNRRAQMTKKLLQDALISLMQEKPFSTITIKELCAQADLNRSTFYLHYSDPRMLLQETEQNVRASLLDYLKQTAETKDQIETLTAFLSYVKQNRNVFALVFNDEEKHFYFELMQDVWKIVHHRDEPAPVRMREDYIIIYTMVGSSVLVREWIARHCDLPERELALIIWAFGSKRGAVDQEVGAILRAETAAQPNTRRETDG